MNARRYRFLLNGFKSSSCIDGKIFTEKGQTKTAGQRHNVARAQRNALSKDAAAIDETSVFADVLELIALRIACNDTMPFTCLLYTSEQPGQALQNGVGLVQRLIDVAQHGTVQGGAEVSSRRINAAQYAQRL